MKFGSGSTASGVVGSSGCVSARDKNDSKNIFFVQSTVCFFE